MHLACVRKRMSGDRNIFEVNVGNFEIFCRGLKLQWIRYGVIELI